MLHLPAPRRDQPRPSVDADRVVHLATGEPIATVRGANLGPIHRNIRKASPHEDHIVEFLHLTRAFRSAPL
jgi:hypothetical protein